ncbi:MAG: DUF4097 family beta strand repeat protein [Cryobacterium sp.]|nr:DUF4097 family beta strand repeat protein [Cryobacterium sp.]
MTSQQTEMTSPESGNSKTLRTVLMTFGTLALGTAVALSTVQVAFALNRVDTSGTYTVDDLFDEIEIDGTVSDINIEFGDVSQPKVRFESASKNLSLKYQVVDRDLKITVAFQGFNWWLSFPTWDWSGPKLTVTLPESMRTSQVQLEISNSAGDISIDGDFGDTEVSSAAGEVDITGSVHDLSIETAAGNTTLSDLSVAGELELDGSAGNVTGNLVSLPESIDLSTSAGNIEISLPNGDYRIETKTSLGNIQNDVSSNATSSRLYKFETTFGNIRISKS